MLDLLYRGLESALRLERFRLILAYGNNFGENENTFPPPVGFKVLYEEEILILVARAVVAVV